MNMGSLVPYLLVIFLTGVVADIYMHNPRGSNDRNCEKNVDRQNANRLFNSQNNAAGGYACPYVPGDTGTGNNMYYYSGSKLKIEWAAQHGCGNGRTNCDIILQYMCSNDIRDGIPVSPNSADGTTRIPTDPEQSKNIAYGMHENYDYYESCLFRQRNKGLWTADRLISDWQGATATRQNNGGDRHGFECQEERDYYPYWHTSPWMDIAIFTDNPNQRCAALQQESQNVKGRGWCKPVSTTVKQVQGSWPNNAAACATMNQTWVVDSAWNIPAPACSGHYYSREDHLGNIIDPTSPTTPQLAYYWWTVPTVSSDTSCVLRIRYNITGKDVAAISWPGTFIDYRNNSVKATRTTNATTSPITQDPYIYYEGKLLSVKINSDQYGRTFQDRSYVFKIKPSPNVPSTSTIYNLNVRGKRGNIVQVYPSTEYDFVPNLLSVKLGDYIHFQWVGSDYNPARGPNDAEGGPPNIDNVNDNSRSDRSNLVEALPKPFSANRIYPITNDTFLYANTMFVTDSNTLAANVPVIQRLSFLGQTNCLTLAQIQASKDKNAIERDPHNCAKINTPTPYFDGGLVQMLRAGEFNYICTRNENPSNRDQRGKITVTSGKRSVEDDPVTQPPPEPYTPSNAGAQDPEPPTSDAEQAVLNALRLPPQYCETDVFGGGWGKWMALNSEAIQAMAQGASLALDAINSASNTTTPTMAPVYVTNSGMSSGAAAGLGVGCVIAGIILGAVVVFLVKRSRGGVRGEVLLS